MALRRTHLKPGTYTREVLFSSQEGEVVLITWPPKSRSKMHNHGRSRGKVIVLQGRIFEKKPSEGEDEGEKQYYAPGSILMEKPRDVHCLGNDSDTVEAQTLHIYKPPLKMRFFE